MNNSLWHGAFCSVLSAGGCPLCSAIFVSLREKHDLWHEKNQLHESHTEFMRVGSPYHYRYLSWRERPYLLMSELIHEVKIYKYETSWMPRLTNQNINNTNSENVLKLYFKIAVVK